MILIKRYDYLFHRLEEMIRSRISSIYDKDFCELKGKYITKMEFMKVTNGWFKKDEKSNKFCCAYRSKSHRICKYRSRYSQDVRKHVQTKAEVKFHCLLCPLTTSRNDYLNNHYNNCHFKNSTLLQMEANFNYLFK